MIRIFLVLLENRSTVEMYCGKYPEVSLFRELLLFNATQITKRFCFQVDSMCVIIAHVAGTLDFFSHWCSMNNPLKWYQKHSLAVVLTVLPAKDWLWAEDVLIQWMRQRETILSRCQFQKDGVLCPRLCYWFPTQLGNSPDCRPVS